MTDKTTSRKTRIRQWAASIEEQKASGLTVDQWCEGHEISRSQFYYRQKVVRKALDGESVPDKSAGYETITSTAGTADHVALEPQVFFAELPDTVFPASIPAPVPSSITGTALRLHYGRSTVEVGNDASDRILEFLREVILRGE